MEKMDGGAGRLSYAGDAQRLLCGEAGGDPDSIKFCDEINLDYVSCSPYRVPIARLAAAQAVIEHKFEERDK